MNLKDKDISYDLYSCNSYILAKMMNFSSGHKQLLTKFSFVSLGQKKIVMLPSPDQNLKIGSVGRFFLIFFTYRERVEFSNIF